MLSCIVSLGGAAEVVEEVADEAGAGDAAGGCVLDDDVVQRFKT